MPTKKIKIIPQDLDDLDNWRTDGFAYAGRFCYQHRLTSPEPIKYFLGLGWAIKRDTKWELLTQSEEPKLTQYIMDSVNAFETDVKVQKLSIERSMQGVASKEELDKLRKQLDFFEGLKLPSRSARLVRDIKTLAGGSIDLQVEAKNVDKVDPDEPVTMYTINTPNGLIDLRTGKHIDPPQDMYITKCTAVSPSIVPNSSKWDDTVNAILPDPEVRHYVHKLIGMCLLPKKTDDLFVVFVGSGGNGKTTFLNTISTALGPDYVSNVTSKSIMDSYRNMTGGGVATPDVADLRGKRLALLSETKENDYFDTGIIKLLSGGGRIRARFLKKNPIEFDASHQFICDSNSVPRIKNVADLAFKSRLVIVPFTQTFDRHNNTLKAELTKKEILQDVLKWAITGAQMYIEEGLECGDKLPQAIKKALGDYYEENDYMHQYILDRCVQDPNQCVMLKDLYRDFVDWYRYDYGGTNPPGSRSMRKPLEAQVCLLQKQDEYGGYNYVRDGSTKPYRIGTKNTNKGVVVIGVRLKTVDELNVTIKKKIPEK